MLAAFHTLLTVPVPEDDPQGLAQAVLRLLGVPKAAAKAAASPCRRSSCTPMHCWCAGRRGQARAGAGWLSAAQNSGGGKALFGGAAGVLPVDWSACATQPPPIAL